MTQTQRNELERACERAQKAGLRVVGHGYRHIDHAEVYAVPSMRNVNHWHLVAVVGGRLACDCPAGQHGRMCAHRGCVHAFLVEGVKAAVARSARQATGPRLRTDTRPFSIWK
jgi:hypothetical protein